MSCINENKILIKVDQDLGYLHHKTNFSRYSSTEIVEDISWFLTISLPEKKDSMKTIREGLDHFQEIKNSLY